MSTTAPAAAPGALAGRAFAYWLTAYRRTWRGTMVSGFLAPALYLATLGFGLGSLVDRGGAGAIQGVAYAAFVAPGVFAATAMQTAVNESSYPVMAAIQWQRQYHAMLAGPLGVVDVLLGHLAFVLLRTAIVSVAFLVVGVALGAFTSWWLLLALPAAALLAAAHAAPVMALAARMRTDDGFALIFRFGVVPMFLFSGTFFPVTLLPAVVRPIAWATPLWHGTSLIRDLALSRAGLAPSLAHVAYLLVWVVLGVGLARRSYTARLVE
jgi:lipooligosaccharide transport system permease protein